MCRQKYICHQLGTLTKFNPKILAPAEMYLPVNNGQNFVFLALKSHLDQYLQNFNRKLRPKVIHQIEPQNYETAEGVSLPRSTLYNHYLRHW
jgi:hypothetical protein